MKKNKISKKEAVNVLNKIIYLYSKKIPFFYDDIDKRIVSLLKKTAKNFINSSDVKEADHERSV